MSDSANSPDQRAEGFNADAFKSLNFGPAWASGNAPKSSQPTPRFDEREERRGAGGGARPDRRGFDRPRREFKPAPAESHPESGDAPAPAGDARPPRRDDRGPRRDDRGPRPHGDRPQGERRGPRESGEQRREFGGARREAPFRPVVTVEFYPEDKPFTELLKRLKDSCRTVELFDIAKSILEKNERFQVSIKPLNAEKNPEAKIFRSLPDGLAFLDETEAFSNAFSATADTIFETQTVDVEPPKGTFTTIGRCGLTGEFIAPNNYHGYQKALREHHAAKIANMPFERFVARVETVKDEAAIAAWLEKKKHVTRHVLKDRREGDPESFDTIEAMMEHLHKTRKDDFIKADAQVRMPGKEIENLPAGPLRASIEHELARHRRFPLDTANAIRGRLRRAGFTLYKRGSKGVTFLCGVKRKFRTPSSAPFSDALAKVFSAIESLQDIAAGKYVTHPALAEKLLGAKPEGDDTSAYDAAITELAANLRYLVSEGYVTEFADGSLFALPIQTEAQAKAAAAEEAKTTEAVAETPAESPAPEAAPEAEATAE